MQTQRTNVLLSKLFERIHDGVTDPAGSVSHYQTWTNPRWKAINSTFTETRTLSLPLFLGVRCLMVGIEELVISPEAVKVQFNECVGAGNSNFPESMRSDLSMVPVAGLSSLDGEFLRYETNSRSLGFLIASPAIDCLTASVLFAEALRRLIYQESCPFAKEAVKSFMELYDPKLQGNRDQAMMDCSDALYMVGTYRPTGEKLGIMSEHVWGFDIPGESYSGSELDRLLSRDFLRYLL